MSRYDEDLNRLEAALEDDSELPKAVRKRVHAYNSDKTDISPTELTEKMEKKRHWGWLLVLVLLAAALTVAKWKGLI